MFMGKVRSPCKWSPNGVNTRANTEASNIRLGVNLIRNFISKLIRFRVPRKIVKKHETI